MTSDSRSRLLVLVALDGSERDARAAEAGGAIVERFAMGELHLLHVLPGVLGDDIRSGPWPGPEFMETGRAIVDAAARAAHQVCTRMTVGHLAVGTAWEEVVRVGRDLEADLLVVGTRDRTGPTRVAPGSVAQQILRHASCPALVVRPKAPSPSADERPCAGCLRTRTESSGARYWCARHAKHHPRDHWFYEIPRGNAVG